MSARIKLAALVAVAVAAAGTAAALAGGGSSIREKLSGYEETPFALSTPGEGKFEARIDKRDQRISYRLSYADLESDITQAHIHFGSPSQSGGISVFLCTNLGNGPAGTQPCPPQPATITGTIVPSDVIGPASQGIAPGEFGELLDAIRADMTYANVHTTERQMGEIRAQIERGSGD